VISRKCLGFPWTTTSRLRISLEAAPGSCSHCCPSPRGWFPLGPAGWEVRGRTPPRSTMVVTPRRSRLSSTQSASPIEDSWRCSSRPTEPTSTKPSWVHLPLRDLLDQRGPAGNCRGHDSRRRCVRSLAREDGDEGQPSRSVLGRRAGAPKLLAAFPRRLQSPIPSAGNCAREGSSVRVTWGRGEAR
jgi:hypothetical protein